LGPEQLEVALTEVLADLGGAARASELIALLRHACHDMNNALGTLSLEHYSVGAILDDVAVSMPPAEFAELRSALANADGARTSCERLVEALHRSAKALDE